MLGVIGEIKDEVKFLSPGTLLYHTGNKAKTKSTIIRHTLVYTNRKEAFENTHCDAEDLGGTEISVSNSLQVILVPQFQNRRWKIITQIRRGKKNAT